MSNLTLEDLPLAVRSLVPQIRQLASAIHYACLHRPDRATATPRLVEHWENWLAEATKALGMVVLPILSDIPALPSYAIGALAEFGQGFLTQEHKPSAFNIQALRGNEDDFGTLYIKASVVGTDDGVLGVLPLPDVEATWLREAIDSVGNGNSVKSSTSDDRARGTKEGIGCTGAGSAVAGRTAQQGSGSGAGVRAMLILGGLQHPGMNVDRRCRGCVDGGGPCEFYPLDREVGCICCKKKNRVCELVAIAGGSGSLLGRYRMLRYAIMVANPEVYGWDPTRASSNWARAPEEDIPTWALLLILFWEDEERRSWAIENESVVMLVYPTSFSLRLGLINMWDSENTEAYAGFQRRAGSSCASDKEGDSRAGPHLGYERAWSEGNGTDAAPPEGSVLAWLHGETGTRGCLLEERMVRLEQGVANRKKENEKLRQEIMGLQMAARGRGDHLAMLREMLKAVQSPSPDAHARATAAAAPLDPLSPLPGLPTGL
ncbi:uncharacterized protein BXZ73DRAFT_83585 [Epithele typhae]|uniref:uncharacterized protein n=1 Tax=Epithele typhae TaxID=378194 RepID=UPI0020075EBE|nr:uncharacterized protein BXZ73DRAFT_83585 [Epithele typhae]KAH9910423.1 hypothetical protein BXZ73DRAFT_83585 [Epithele typhae]